LHPHLLVTQFTHEWVKMSVVHAQPQGPAFDIVLLLHVGCVVAGLATLVTSAATAARLRRLLRAGSPVPESVVRYFRPGVNWAGRVMYGIPVFGFALLAMSQGAFALSDGWVMAGLAVFVVVVLLAEGILWPAERRLQVAVSSAAGDGDGDGDGDAGGDAGAGAVVEPTVMRDAQLMIWSATAALVLLIVGTAIMVAQP
jgi:hypothetical protein